MDTNRNPAPWSVVSVLLFPVRVLLVALCVALVVITAVPAALLSIPHMLKVPHAPAFWGIPMGFGAWILFAQQIGRPHAELHAPGIRIRLWPFGPVRNVAWGEVATIRAPYGGPVYVPPRTIVLSSGQELSVRVFRDTEFDAAAREKGVFQE
jgi:hypothetical protein